MKTSREKNANIQIQKLNLNICMKCKYSYVHCHPYIFHRLGMESEETTSTDINNPGAYSTVCVELDVASLAVNTIIEVSNTLQGFICPFGNASHTFL